MCAGRWTTQRHQGFGCAQNHLSLFFCSRARVCHQHALTAPAMQQSLARAETQTHANTEFCRLCCAHIYLRKHFYKWWRRQSAPIKWQSTDWSLAPVGLQTPIKFIAQTFVLIARQQDNFAHTHTSNNVAADVCVCVTHTRCVLLILLFGVGGHRPTSGRMGWRVDQELVLPAHLKFICHHLVCVGRIIIIIITRWLTLTRRATIHSSTQISCGISCSAAAVGVFKATNWERADGAKLETKQANENERRVK